MKEKLTKKEQGLERVIKGKSRSIMPALGGLVSYTTGVALNISGFPELAVLCEIMCPSFLAAGSMYYVKDLSEVCQSKLNYCSKCVSKYMQPKNPNGPYTPAGAMSLERYEEKEN